MKRYGIDAYIEERDAERILNKILFVIAVAVLLWIGIWFVQSPTFPTCNDAVTVHGAHYVCARVNTWEEATP